MMRTVRFLGLNAIVEGDVLEIELPVSGPPPEDVIKGVAIHYGLSPSQTEEVFAKASDFSAVNFLLDHREV